MGIGVCIVADTLLASMKRSAELLLKGSILILSFLAPFLVVEAYFRLQYPTETPAVASHGPDPVVGWDRIPPVRALSNTGARRKIFFLGDSNVDGREWTAVAQRDAAARGVPFDGFVLGVSGHGTTQQLLKLQRHFDEQKPDLVVLLFTTWNDIRDNVRTPSLFYSPTLITRPYYVPQGEKFLLWNKPASAIARFLSKSEVYVRILQRLKIKFYGAIAERSVDWIAGNRLPLALYYDAPASWESFYDAARQDGEYVRLAYAVTEHNLREMKRFLDARGTKFIALGIDNAFTVDSDVFDAHVRHPEEFQGDLPLRRMETIFRGIGVPFQSTLRELRAEQKRIEAKIYNDPPGNIGGHLEPEGERVLGRLATDLILRAYGR